MRQQLYFIAIIPPEPVYSEIKEFQQYAADKYKSKEALKRPTHATLISPFRIDESREKELISFVDSIATREEKFEVAIDGFGSFTTGVVYASIVVTDKLKKLEKDLTSTFYRKFGLTKEKGPSHAFTPHITVAYKDLSPLVFPQAWNEFKDKIYRRKWTMKDICILRNNAGWEVIKRAEFQREEIMTLGF